MIHAYCWASGLIGFGDTIPKGALPIQQDCSVDDMDKIKARSRVSYQGKYLVPGVPEAKDQTEALKALFKFEDWIKNEKKCQINPSKKPKKRKKK